MRGREQTAKLESGEITREEYDIWRYHYPELDTAQKKARFLSQGLSDMLIDSFIIED